MAKPARNAFTVAVEMALRQRDDARRMLQDLRSQSQAAQEQLRLLEGYAQETQSRWGLRPDAAVAPEVMFHHYKFMDRLHHAAGLQVRVVGEHAERVMAAEKSLFEAEVRLASLNKLVEKRQRETLRAQARMDQKQTDERAALQQRHSLNGH